eukprot:Selendium_serpulae@DN6135_c0_g2_i4.p1
MALKIAVFVLALGSLSGTIRHQTTTSIFEAHYREQLFISDAPGAAPLDAAESLVRLQLWRKQSTGGTGTRQRNEAVARRQSADRGVELRVFQSEDHFVVPDPPRTPYAATNLSLPPLLLFFLSEIGETGISPVAVNVAFDCALVFSMLGVMSALSRIEPVPAADKKDPHTAKEVAFLTRSMWLAFAYFFNPLSMMLPLTFVPRSLYILPTVFAVAAAASTRRAARQLAPVSLGCALYLMPLTPALMILPIGYLLQFKGKLDGSFVELPQASLIADSANKSVSAQPTRDEKGEQRVWKTITQILLDGTQTPVYAGNAAENLKARFCGALDTSAVSHVPCCSGLRSSTVHRFAS